YTPGGSWELTTLFESSKHTSKAGLDGGPDPAMYEVGSNLALSPFAHGLVGYWKFNEVSGTNAADSIGYGRSASLSDASSTNPDR
ncbi:hypothetical protein HY227_01095, partial [Candidatus Wolfebacteria bacterium]|nr:hypothetical protein [Candidatus Wolfebacteria bacterium]